MSGSKAISEIIATILMLMITIGIASTAWMFVQGRLTSSISESFQIIDSSGTDIFVKNTGTDYIRSMNGFLDGGPVNIAVMPNMPGMAGYWSFNDGTNQTADDSGNGRDGTLYNSPLWVNGKHGKALQFTNATGQSVVTNFSIALGNVTFSAWVFTTDAQTSGDWNYFIYIMDSFNMPVAEFGTWGDSVIFKPCDYIEQCVGAANYGVSGGTLPKNSWTHISGTVSGSQVRIYVNGKLADSRDDFPGFSSWNGNSNNIGGSNDRTFSGIIDEVSIYTMTLSDSEIQNMYNGLIWPDSVATVRILNPSILQEGVHTVKLCTSSQCSTTSIMV